MRKREKWDIESDEELKGSSTSTPSNSRRLSHKRAKSQHFGEEVSRFGKMEKIFRISLLNHALILT